MMQIKIPFRKLISYSLMLSLAVLCFSFLLAWQYDVGFLDSLRNAVFGWFILSATAFISIGLIYVFECRKAGEFTSNSHTRFIIGCFINICFMLFCHYLRMRGEETGLIPQTVLAPHKDPAISGWDFYVLIPLFSIGGYSLVHFLHNSILLQHVRMETELELSRLRSINAETVNQLLRQQIQPHFLFNALNVLKSLIRKYPDTAEEYLVRLSDFLRSSMSKNTSGTALVEDEIKLCKDYLEMQYVRFGEALTYKFDIRGDLTSCVLPFFSLQPLVENAIKHNELTEDKPLHIEVTADGDCVKVVNNLQRKQAVDGSTGFGLSSLSERYKKLSGQDIEIIEDGTSFAVALKIIKNENHNY